MPDCSFPTSDIFGTNWLNQSGSSGPLFSSVNTDPLTDPETADYCEAFAGASELTFGFSGLAEPASTIDVVMHGTCVSLGGPGYAGIGCAVFLRDHAHRLIGSSGTRFDLWSHGAGGPIVFTFATYEANRGTWDLAGGPAQLQLIFLDDYAGSTFVAGFRLNALKLCMTGSGDLPGGGVGPGGQVGQNASILIPLMVQP